MEIVFKNYIVYLGLVAGQTVIIIFLTYVDRVFKNLKKKVQIFQRFENVWHFWGFRSELYSKRWK